MANVLYDAGREAFLAGDAAWDSDDFRVVLLSSGYTFSQTHDNLDDVAGGARISTSAALGGKTTAGGVADANDVTFTALAAGSTIVGLLVYKHTGNEATSRLIVFYDTKGDSSAISVPTNGGDVIVQWAASGNKMFKV